MKWKICKENTIIEQTFPLAYQQVQCRCSFEETQKSNKMGVGMGLLVKAAPANNKYYALRLHVHLFGFPTTSW